MSGKYHHKIVTKFAICRLTPPVLDVDRKGRLTPLLVVHRHLIELSDDFIKKHYVY